MIDHPLEGKRVVNTRAPHQAAELDALLRTCGAEPVAYPCIDIAPPEDARSLDDALRAAARGAFDWLVLTSANTALSLSRRVDALELDRSGLHGMKIAAVGPASAEAARDYLGLEATLLPEEYVAESLVEALRIAPGARVLLPQSDLARPVLADGLAAAGLAVSVVVAYRTVIGSGGADVPALLAAGRIDAVTFTSSSTLENFLVRLGQAGQTPDVLAGVCIACIGPVTAKTAQEHHLPVAVVPEQHTLEGLVNDLESYFMEARQPQWPISS
jgi:uroporphyrinogen-III synthase